MLNVKCLKSILLQMMGVPGCILDVVIQKIRSDFMVNNFNDLTSSIRVRRNTKITLWENDVGIRRSSVLTDYICPLLLNFTMVLKEDVPGCIKTIFSGIILEKFRANNFNDITSAI